MARTTRDPHEFKPHSNCRTDETKEFSIAFQLFYFQKHKLDTGPLKRQDYSKYRNQLHEATTHYLATLNKLITTEQSKKPLTRVYVETQHSDGNFLHELLNEEKRTLDYLKPDAMKAHLGTIKKRISCISDMKAESKSPRAGFFTPAPSEMKNEETRRLFCLKLMERIIEYNSNRSRWKALSVTNKNKDDVVSAALSILRDIDASGTLTIDAIQHLINIEFKHDGRSELFKLLISIRHDIFARCLKEKNLDAFLLALDTCFGDGDKHAWSTAAEKLIHLENLGEAIRHFLCTPRRQLNENDVTLLKSYLQKLAYFDYCHFLADESFLDKFLSSTQTFLMTLLTQSSFDSESRHMIYKMASETFCKHDTQLEVGDITIKTLVKLAEHQLVALKKLTHKSDDASDGVEMTMTSLPRPMTSLA